jgi:hypothetical protein
MHGTIKKKTNVQSRTAILLHEDNIPPATWKLGITKINQGSGTLVKTVTTHTRQGTFKQTLNKLCQPPKDRIHYSIESLPYIQPLICTSGYRRFILCSTLGHMGGSNSCGGYTLMRVATTHAG